MSRLPLLDLAEGARVTLLHVVSDRLPPTEQRRAERDASRALTDEAHHLREKLRRDVGVDTVVTRGGAANEIAVCAAKLQSELIVMGRGGGRVLRDAFLGSTAERVVRQSKQPVLVVRQRARSAYGRPALAVELEPAARDVVRFLLRLLPRPRPRVEVIHAFDDLYRGMVYSSLTKDEKKEREDELRSNATRELRKLLGDAITETKVPVEDEPSWKTHVQLGPPRDVVERATRKAESDLLALGTRGRSGVAFAFLGTVAGDLLRAARCDVLIVPPAPSA